MDHLPDQLQQFLKLLCSLPDVPRCAKPFLQSLDAAVASHPSSHPSSLQALLCKFHQSALILALAMLVLGI